MDFYFQLVDPFLKCFRGDYSLSCSLQVERPLPELTKAQFLRLLPKFLVSDSGVVDLQVRAAMSELLDQNPMPTIHDGIKCDGCGQCPLIGARYKCTVCADFDLCQSCEGRSMHPAEHALIKSKHAITASNPVATTPSSTSYVPGAFGTWRSRAVTAKSQESSNFRESPSDTQMMQGNPASLWNRRSPMSSHASDLVGAGRQWRASFESDVQAPIADVLPMAEFVKVDCTYF